MKDDAPRLTDMARQPKIISEFDRKLGAAIRNRRTDPEYGMTQKKLARVTGIPLSNLQRREEGENEVTVSELERIAFALKTTPLALVQDALARYGGLNKLLQEYGPKPDDPDASGGTDEPDLPTLPKGPRLWEATGNVTAADNVTYLGHVKPPMDAAADENPRTSPKE